ncbi:hypothetical protein C0995_008314 [Termitomyces sp. Mi166|nr:hypothetical protein C0995_008314 [Termitomyces sp. Mi166\
MTKRRRDGGKAQQSRRRLRKTEEVSIPLAINKRSITAETKNKAKNEEIAPKVRLGPNIILTGPNRSATDVVEETDRESATSEIPYGQFAKPKCDSKDPLHSQKTEKDSKDYMRAYGRQKNGREVTDYVVPNPIEGRKNKCAMSEVLPDTMGQLRHMEKKLRKAEEWISQLELALDEKSKELDAAVSFMNVIEPLSSADIIGLANTFNAEVFQGAAYIAESLASSRHRHRGYQKRTAQYTDEYKQALMSLGPDLLQDLIEEAKDHSGNFFLLRVALQVCMVTFGVNVLQTWSSDTDEHRVTDQIYRRILSQEIQGVAGSWRSVTRRSQVSEPMHRKEKIDALLYTVIDILTVAGCWGREDDSSVFFTKFQGNIARVVDSALKLRDDIGNVTHVDILPMTVPPESHFCPDVMTNCYPSNTGTTGVSELDRVLATTELGLEQKVNGLKGVIHCDVLLKPKSKRLADVRKYELLAVFLAILQ